jgi:hypothetical protein
MPTSENPHAEKTLDTLWAELETFGKVSLEDLSGGYEPQREYYATLSFSPKYRPHQSITNHTGVFFESAREALVFLLTEAYRRTRLTHPTE